MNNDVTLVVCTCDAYEDAWDPLFKLINRYWKDFDYQVILNTETKVFAFKGLDILSPGLYKDIENPGSIPWSKRLKEHLIRYVKTEFTLIYLDDFYLEGDVNTVKLEKCISIMKQDKTIANIQLFPCPPKYGPFEKYDWLVIRKKESPYLLNLQAGLWRKERLIHFLRDHESPWYFERWGSVRARRYPDKFISINPELPHNMIFNYNPSKIGLSQGKWLPDTKELFRKEKIQVDIHLRGVKPVGFKPPNYSRNYSNSAVNIFKSLCP